MTGTDPHGRTSAETCAARTTTPGGATPLRGPLLSADLLADCARRLAGEQSYATVGGPRVTPLLPAVQRNDSSLLGFRKTMDHAAREKKTLPAASEWLLDNFYLIQEQTTLVQEDLPRGYGALLPHLTEGPYQDYPRVYEAMVSLIEHSDARLDREYLERFLRGYQDVVPLTIGEVWATPIMLRAALVENLARLAARVQSVFEGYQRADEWANRVLTVPADETATLQGELDRLSTECDREDPAFFARLYQRLSAQDLVQDAITGWMGRRLAGLDVDIEDLLKEERHGQATDQVSIANSITSIRFLNAFDWKGFFEETSHVERILSRDPVGAYARMDFQSRDRYRHAVEMLARGCPASETCVANAVVARAKDYLEADPDDRVRGHVGWHLISDGRYAFERELDYRPTRRERVHRGPLKHQGLVFFGLIALLTALVVGLIAWYAVAYGATARATVLVALLAAIPASDIAITLVNRLSTMVWPPRPLPKLDFREPLGTDRRTLVVIAALLASPADIDELVERIEVHRLSSASDPDLHFGLVLDLKGADQEHLPGDEELERAARSAVAGLNIRYAASGEGPFHLFIRGRTYDESDERWMGWERKRGALVELNRLLRGEETSFEVVEGDAEFLPGVVFVATLDADTAVARDAVPKLVATIAHPLNRAKVDPERRCVTRGYGLIQPRVSITLASSLRTYYAWMHTGGAGIDAYGGAVSDAYQDVFGQGSFTGKGLYEVDVFREVLEGRIPEDRLLSHDLLEGSFASTALASDIEVFDDFPARYSTQNARMHRWTRGDWQTLPWLMPRVPTEDGPRERTVLSGLARWKLFDNLRRSLVPVALFALIVAGGLLVPERTRAWALIVLAMLLFPAIVQFVDAIIRRPKDVSFRGSVRSTLTDARRDGLRGLFALAVLPHQAWLMSDAIVRALYRSLISKKNMLQWVTAAEAERGGGTTIEADVRSMWPAILFAVALVALEMVAGPTGWFVLAAVALLWIASPWIVFSASRDIEVSEHELSAEEVRTVRRYARKTWRFFETFVTAEDNWLAPDNYQEDPKGVVAHRTSPTNVGLQLLSYLTAYDLGWLSVPGLSERVSRTLQTLAGMERFHGHFYNWYDTRTLQPLPPGYVSTVDSGNLAGHLIVLGIGLSEAADEPFLGPQLLDGLRDTLLLAIDESARADAAREDTAAAPVEEDRSGEAAAAEERAILQKMLQELEAAGTPVHVGDWSSLTGRLSELAAGVPSLGLEPDAPALGPAEVLAEIGAMRDALDLLAPWAGLLADVPEDLSGSGRFGEEFPLAQHVPSVRELADCADEWVASLKSLAAERVSDAAVSAWAEDLASDLSCARPAAVEMLARLQLMSSLAAEIWGHTDFRILYDDDRDLFSIGYNTAAGELDASYYDMLASECRLASFLAVARGEVPQSHWFRLGRPMTSMSEGYALLSWSASMFEYLMPLLVMRSWPGTLLDETYRTVVSRQIEYGLQRGTPWGISESAFNAKDVDLNYQYQAFGIPGLGLKRGLSDDVVIAPYATVLALEIDEGAALENLQALRERGAEGRFGFYEAIDYTPGRIPAGEERAVVKAYMAHHQGMSLAAMGGRLTGGAMQRRFRADPLVKSAEILLQERVPRHIVLAHPNVEEVEHARSVRELPPPGVRSYPTPHTPVPATHFLSNGAYSVMVTNSGGGYSRFEELEVTRYREDVTRDCWGTFFYLKDVEEGRVWSAAYQPVGAEPDDYHVVFSTDKAEYRRTDGDIETGTEVTVSPEDDVEVRRLTITNHGPTERTIEVTSYFEASLAAQGADAAHRAFSNLFVETDVEEHTRAVLFTRRPRASTEARVWGVHVVATDKPDASETTFETDRAAFLGRLRTARDPVVLDPGAELTGTTGAVLDPACALRRSVTLGPGETGRLAFSTGVAQTREDAVDLARKYADIRTAQRTLDLAWTSSEIVLRDLGIAPEDSVTFQRLASRLLVTDAYSPLKVRNPVENGLPISGLWALGISGDLPILLVRIERLEDAPLVRQALLAHQYWRYTGLEADLVILNTRPSAYSDELEGRLKELVRTGHALQLLDKPGGVFIRRADQMSGDTRNLLETVARATLTGDAGSLLFQLNQRAQRPDLPFGLAVQREPEDYPSRPLERPELLHDNGYGGFDRETGEYVVVVEGDTVPPAPWINVMSNEHEFGSLISESGGACTWSLNSHENRLTTWNNDAVSDGTGEFVYIRDEETGEFWSPTPLPVRTDAPFVVRHGRGHTSFSSEQHGLAHDLTVFVPPDRPVRVARLELENTGERRRTLTVTQFAEWSLGSSRSRAQQQVVTWYDAEDDMLTAHNHYNMDFPGRTTFLASDRSVDSYTADRTEFLGRNGEPARPAALQRAALGAQTGRFHDACGAISVKVLLGPGERVSVSFFLGQTHGVEEARSLVDDLRRRGAVEEALAQTRSAWDDLLGTLQVRTPEPDLDLLINGWLLYQSLSCRLWGRTALYQSSGAYGFRDQLQDSLAFALARPQLLRAQILEAAHRQFPEGDVQHWWMPVSGRGVRTRISDDRHWLAYCTAAYIEATGDTGILDVEVPFLEGPLLADGQDDLYLEPSVSERTAPLYEHCVAALETARPVGEHGLPLIGGGDWNDGMNRVGIEGRGESVWLAWFLDVTLRRFAAVCEGHGDSERAADYRAWAAGLVEAVDREAWDGAWYRRAFFDDGTPLGTDDAEECRIDAIAQAWSALSGAGDGERAATALDSVDEHLVDEEAGLVKLLAPPFDRMTHDPGYIKGYVPGVRENGGQYTHGVLWVALARLARGDAERAVELLRLLSPVGHAGTTEGTDSYKVEPYVVAADVYSADGHVGHGGWTWYTGSAAWFHRVVTEHLLGITVVAVEGERRLSVRPCIPASWPGFSARVRLDGASFEIEVDNSEGDGREVRHVLLDGEPVPEPLFPAGPEGGTHAVRVVMGRMG